MASNTYRPFTCSECGDALSAREVANESKFAVEGTAGARIRNVTRQCAECHAANEYKRHQAMQAYAEEMGYNQARRMVESGEAANLSEALERLGK